MPRAPGSMKCQVTFYCHMGVTAGCRCEGDRAKGGTWLRPPERKAELERRVPVLERSAQAHEALSVSCWVCGFG